MKAFFHFLGRLLRIRWLSVLLVSLLVVLLMVFAYIKQPRLMSMLDHKVYDTLLYLYGDKETSEVPVIIDLDEESLAKFGQWPWPRFLLAELLYRLAVEGVSAVGVDALLIEEDRTSPKHLQEDMRRFLDLNIGFENLPDQFYDYDALLANMLQQLPVVLGMYFHFDGTPPTTDAVPPAVTTIVQKQAGAEHMTHSLLAADSASIPLPVFRDATPFGLLNMNPDEDGVVRRIPLLAEYKGRYYASLSLRSLMLARNIKNLILVIGRDGLEALRLGKTTIPVTPEGHITIPFKGPSRTYPYYSAGDVLTGNIPEGALKGRIAFLGTSAAGLLDIRITPLERVYPGVEVHATVLDAILQEKFLRVPPWTPGIQMLAIILGGIIAALSFGFARPRVYVVVAALLLGGTLYAAIHLFKRGFVVSPLYALLTIVLLGVFLLLLRFWQEERQKNVLRGAFSRYVAPEVVARITRLEGDIFAGEELEASIMFTDIRKFTTISESLTPEQVVSLLNRYFTPMTALVRSAKGTLDKFIGDALMAFWNAPLPVPGHPALALQTALAMHRELALLNTSLKEDFGHEIRMGVGVHTGKIFVGNMGSEELLNYTIIGDNVNLSSRLEGLCSQYGVTVVTSAETKKQAEELFALDTARGGNTYGRGFAFQQLDTLRVKGKTQPVDVFSVLEPDNAALRAEELAQWGELFTAYRDGNFTSALRLADDLLGRFPETVVYRIYAERCRTLAAAPPDSWDGVWTMTSK